MKFVSSDVITSENIDISEVVISEIKPPSDDEGVFDLDQEEEQSHLLKRITAMPVRNRHSARLNPNESRASPAKEKLLCLTHSKLKSIGGSDGLLNKVLLEEALKKFLIAGSPEKSVLDKQRASHVASSHPNDTKLSKSNLSLMSSPRKRSASESSAVVKSNGRTSPIKRLKSLHYEDMEVTVSANPRKDELFSDLANVFYRLKTEQ